MSARLYVLALAGLVLALAPAADGSRRLLQSSGVCPRLPTGNDNAAPVSPYYKWGSYADLGPQYAGLGTLGFPAGAAGTLDVYTQQAEFVASRADVAVNLALALGTMELRCRSGGCLTNLWSFDSLYAGLPAGMQPALANFGVGPKGDAAFARMRLTVAPLLIKLVPSYAALPIQEADINGLASMISGTGLSLRQLVAARRVFAVDFRPFAPLLAPSPGGVLEVPVGLFYVAGPGNGTQLMPLAIQFTVNNRNVYSPADARADWLLAKAAFNALDTAMHAGLHFMTNHFVLNNVCIAARRNLDESHPLYPLIAMPCKYNSGIIKTGLPTLLSNVSGSFDEYLMVSGASLVNMLPVLAAQFSWGGAFLSADLAARGIAGIPGFAYAADAGASYSALLEYATSVLSPFYGGWGGFAAIRGDKQLQGFLRALGPGGAGAIRGFPLAWFVNSLPAVARIAAQTMWLAGVQHHALNSNKPSNYDFVYPTAPGKLFAPPPDKKGVLTEAALLSQVLLPPSVPMPDGSTVSGWSFFKGAFTVGFDFRILPALRPEQQLLNAYTNAWQPPAGCPVAGALAAAAATLNSRLRAISTAIQAREAPLITTLPQFTLLDPAQMPYFTYT